MPPFIRTRSCLFVASLLAAGAHAAAWAQENGEAQTAAASAVEARQASFTIRLDAPSETRRFLRRYLQLERYRQVPDIDRVELDRLLEVSHADIRQLLSTQGYFTPTVTQTVDEAGNGARALPEVHIVVDPGPRARIEDLQLDFTGDIASYPPARQQLIGIRRQWSLSPGADFTQSAWNGAKTRVLRSLQVERFPEARLLESEAEIDPENAAARLRLNYDSGPAYRLGPVRVEGNERYDPLIAERLARLRQGDDYRQQDLLDAQQRLVDSGYYRSAYISIDHGEAIDPQAAPVRVEVQEAERQKLIFGIGVSTDRGARLSTEHTHNTDPLFGWRSTAKVSLDKISRSGSMGWLAPPEANLWRTLFAVSAQSETIDDYRLVSQEIKAGRTKLEGGIDRTAYLQYDRNQTSGLRSGDLNASSLLANYVWTYRRFDNLAFPRSGYGLMLALGVGSTLSPIRSPLTRVHGRYQGFFPLDGDLSTSIRKGLPLPGQLTAIAVGDAQKLAERQEPNVDLTEDIVPRRHGELVLRVEAGSVIARDAAPVPSTLMFLTGGDATVRGYGYQEIGVADAYGKTQAGRHMLVGSVEYRRPFPVEGNMTDWDMVTFIDAGAVSDELGKFKPKVGVGTGALWRSPVGPVQMALAWGVQSRRLRLHLNLGFSF